MKIIKNKFVIAFLISLLIFVCLIKLNQYKDLNNEEKNKDENNKSLMDKIKLYSKNFVISYLLSLVLVFASFKGYEYYTKYQNKKTMNKNFLNSNLAPQSSLLVSQQPEKQKSTTQLNTQQPSPQPTKQPTPQPTPQPTSQSSLTETTQFNKLEKQEQSNTNNQIKKLTKSNNELEKELLREQKLIAEKARQYKKKQQELKNRQTNINRKEEFFNTGQPNF